MPRPRSQRANVQDVLDQAVDVAADAFFDRAYDFVEKIRGGRMSPAALPPEYAKQLFVCAACPPTEKRPLPIGEMEMVHPDNGFGTCRKCYAFMWDAAEQKLRFLAKQATRQAAPGAPPRTPGAPPPRQKPPWEILGVAADASEEEIKKAYRIAAAKTHPDTVPPGASTEEKDRARAKFEELTRARDAMLKVRQPAKPATP